VKFKLKKISSIWL